MTPHVLPPPVLAGLPTKSRVLTAIRWLYRRDGLCPSHGDIGKVAGIATRRVSGYVHKLARDGVLTYRHGQRRSIHLVDRGAMLSDDEIRLAAIGRGMVIADSPLPALADAFPVVADEGVANWGLKLLAELDDIDSASARPGPDAPGGDHGEAGGEDEDPGNDARGDRRAEG